MYEQFLSLAALSTVKCSEISLYDKTVFQETEDGKKHYHPIKFIYIQEDVRELTEPRRLYYLFDYKTIASQYNEIIRKWYAEKSDMAPVREHLIESVKDKTVYSSVDFLIVIQAVEGFWWRFRDDNYRKINKIFSESDTAIRTILGELIKEFDSVSKIKSLDLDIASIVDSRHYYSHFFDKSKKPKVLDGLKLLDATFKLRVLLICCVLNFTGFDYSQINEILNHSNNDLLDCLMAHPGNIYGVKNISQELNING